MAPLFTKESRLIANEAAKDTVDASDVVTAIIEAGESGLDNSGLKKLGDVDDFKIVNDRYGHEAGDVALICVSNIMESICAGTGLSGGEVKNF